MNAIKYLAIKNNMIFRDRNEAGRLLADKLLKYKKDNVVVIALARGGVIMGYEVAKALNAQLIVMVVRKLSLPDRPEYGIGAITQGGFVVVDQKVASLFRISKSILEDIKQKEKKELKKRLARYSILDAIPNVVGKVVLLIDDGLATGVTITAAIKALKSQRPKKIIVGVPVCAEESLKDISSQVTNIICLYTPKNFYAVGNWYGTFSQVTDKQVLEILQKAKSKVY